MHLNLVVVTRRAETEDSSGAGDVMNMKGLALWGPEPQCFSRQRRRQCASLSAFASLCFAARRLSSLLCSSHRGLARWLGVARPLQLRSGPCYWVAASRAAPSGGLLLAGPSRMGSGARCVLSFACEANIPCKSPNSPEPVWAQRQGANAQNAPQPLRAY